MRTLENFGGSGQGAAGWGFEMPGRGAIGREGGPGGRGNVEGTYIYTNHGYRIRSGGDACLKSFSIFERFCICLHLFVADSKFRNSCLCYVLVC